MRSDTDCEGSSESETQRENMVQTVHEKTACNSKPDFTVDDQSSDKDQLIRKVQSITLTCPGTVMELCLE